MFFLIILLLLLLLYIENDYLGLSSLSSFNEKFLLAFMRLQRWERNNIFSSSSFLYKKQNIILYIIVFRLPHISPSLLITKKLLDLIRGTIKKDEFNLFLLLVIFSSSFGIYTIKSARVFFFCLFIIFLVFVAVLLKNRRLSFLLLFFFVLTFL